MRPGIFRGTLCLLMVFGLAGCGEDRVTLHASDQIPDDLAEWGIVQRQGEHLVWSKQVEVYDLNTPLFTDYAHKLRTLYIPEGKKSELNENGTLSYPVGTIFSKTFYYPRGEEAGEVLQTTFVARELKGGLSLETYRLLETRLLVHYESGWKAISYVWDDEQRLARREVTGALTGLTLVKPDGRRQAFTYAVPDANQCIGCHATAFSSKQALPIGPSRLRFIDRQAQAAWQARGWLDEAAELHSVAPDWQDPKVPIESRARAYLDINCGHCHSPNGAGDTSGLWLQADVTALNRLGVCKAPIAAGQGTGGNRWGIHPGRPDDSILVYRLMSRDPGAMMPELGRSLVHEEGVALVRDWIKGMEGDCPVTGNRAS